MLNTELKQKENGLQLPGKRNDIVYGVLSQKHEDKFYFYYAIPINKMIDNEKGSQSNARFKDMQTLVENNQYLKRYYFLNVMKKQEIHERLKILVRANTQINFQYHSMIVANMEQIRNRRFRQKTKMTASDDTQRPQIQIIKQTNINEIELDFDFFKDYPDISVSKKDEYINKRSRQSQYENVLADDYNIYQNSIKMEIDIDCFTWCDQDIEKSVNHLVSNFNDYDEDKIIQQYQVIKIKRRRKAEEKINNQKAHKIIKSFSKEQFAKQEELKNLQLLGHHRYSHNSKNKQLIDINGIRDKRLSDYNQSFNIKSNPLIKSNPQIDKFGTLASRKPLSRENYQPKNQEYNQMNQNAQKTHFCLNLNTKQIIMKKYKGKNLTHCLTKGGKNIYTQKSEQRDKQQRLITSETQMEFQRPFYLHKIQNNQSNFPQRQIQKQYVSPLFNIIDIQPSQCPSRISSNKLIKKPIWKWKRQHSINQLLSS